MFAEAHMDAIWMQWRPSDKQRAWVFNPGDPNQVDSELIMYYFAMISSAVLACKEEKENNGDTSGITAAEVHRFLLSAAKETPIYTQILSEMRTAETLFLLHQADEDRSSTVHHQPRNKVHVHPSTFLQVVGLCLYL
jgi:hypothetical protein